MIYKCKTGQHLWKDADEANRCCNGWVAVLVPLFHEGLGKKPNFDYEAKDHACFTYVLLPETEKERILDVSSKLPVARSEVAQASSWLKWNN